MSKAKDKTKDFSTRESTDSDMIYSKKHFILIFAGIFLILLGMLLMTGGAMPDNNTWDDNIIYSFRRITLAPILIIAGLAVQIYVIFKK